jgi:RNA polymerase sigma-70 factor, ECF subfamily
MSVSIDSPLNSPRGKLEDLEAYNRLVIKHQDEVYTLAFYLLGDEQSAGEVTSSTFLQAFQRLPRRLPQRLYNWKEPSLRSWLLKQVIQSAQRHPAAALQANLGGAYELCRLLHQLPVECRLAIILVDLLGLSYKEAARTAGMQADKVKACLARGRSAMSEKLA